MPNGSPNNLDSFEIGEPESQSNAVSENACGELVPPNVVTDQINPIELTEKTSNKTNKRKWSLSQKPDKQKAIGKISNNKRVKKSERPPQIWTHGNLELNEEDIKFKGNYDLPEEVSHLEHPYEFFK